MGLWHIDAPLESGLPLLTLGRTMASDSKTAKTEAAPKKADAAPKNHTAKKVESTAAADAPKDASKPAAGETAGAAPANYSRGEGQKQVTAAYKENWNVIFGKKRKKNKKR
jgi:hypothetical protein